MRASGAMLGQKQQAAGAASLLTALSSARERHCGHKGGFPRARLIHCTPDVLTPVISPNMGDSTGLPQ